MSPPLTMSSVSVRLSDMNTTRYVPCTTHQYHEGPTTCADVVLNHGQPILYRARYDAQTAAIYARASQRKSVTS